MSAQPRPAVVAPVDEVLRDASSPVLEERFMRPIFEFAVRSTGDSKYPTLEAHVLRVVRIMLLII